MEVLRSYTALRGDREVMLAACRQCPCLEHASAGVRADREVRGSTLRSRAESGGTQVVLAAKAQNPGALHYAAPELWRPGAPAELPDGVTLAEAVVRSCIAAALFGLQATPLCFALSCFVFTNQC